MGIGSWSLPMRRATLVGAVAALVCLGFSVIIAFGAHEGAVHDNTGQALRAPARGIDDWSRAGGPIRSADWAGQRPTLGSLRWC